MARLNPPCSLVGHAYGNLDRAGGLVVRDAEGFVDALEPERVRDEPVGVHQLVSDHLDRPREIGPAFCDAVVAGAGLITMAVPSPAVPVVDGACLEAMTHPLAAGDDGSIAGPEGLGDLLQRMTAVATGPGMGTGGGASSTLEWILDNWEGDLLLDADAINLLSGRPQRLAGREHPPVLTPHPGELARLLGWTTEEVVSDRVAAARAAAAGAHAVVVAKGFRSIIATPDGEVFINPTGDAGLASGGSGDVLTGTIGAFLAQGLEPTRAALIGCWLHGRAGEIGGEVWPAAVPASVLPDLLAQAWLEFEEP